MKTALLMGLILGTLFPLMGIFVVTRGMAFFSEFIAHSAILGGALALLSGVEPTLFLLPYSVFLGLLASSVWGRMPLSRDTVLGVFYGGTVAGGVMLIAWKGLGQTSLMQFLLGDILLIRPADIWLSAGLLVAFIVLLRAGLRRLIKVSFLPEMAWAEGINVRLYDYALIGITALGVALSIKMVGVLLANAMVVIPAASAKILSRNFRQFMLMAPLIGVLSFTGGIALSFYLNIPSGPTVAMTAFAVFLASLGLRRL